MSNVDFGVNVAFAADINGGGGGGGGGGGNRPALEAAAKCSESMTFD